MTCAANLLHLLALTVWNGTIAVFSFVVAPTLFRIFPIADAGRLIQARAGALGIRLQASRTAPEARRKFAQLHRRAVQLNGLVPVCGIAVCMAAAGALKP